LVGSRGVVPGGRRGIRAAHSAPPRESPVLGGGGFWFYPYAREHGLAALFAPQFGYYQLLVNLAALGAASVAVEHAPAVTTAVAFAVHLIPVAIVLAGRSTLCQTLAQQTLAIACIVLTLPWAEIWLTTTTNSQFVLSLAVLLLLLEDRVPQGPPAYLRAGFLLFAGLSGIPSCLAMPLFLLKALLRRERRALLQAGALALGCAVQGIALIATGGGPYAAHRHASLSFRLLGGASLVKGAVLPILGYQVAGAAAAKAVAASSSALVGALGLAIWLALLWIATSGEDRKQRPLSIAAVAFFVVAQLFGALGDKASMLSPIYAERYFFAPNNVLTVALASSTVGPQTGRLARAACAVLLLLSLKSGLQQYRLDRFEDQRWPRWTDEVALWRRFPLYQPAIWPPAYRVRLR
jgi:hypothetical protein